MRCTVVRHVFSPVAAGRRAMVSEHTVPVPINMYACADPGAYGGPVIAVVVVTTVVVVVVAAPRRHTTGVLWHTYTPRYTRSVTITQKCDHWQIYA